MRHLTPLTSGRRTHLTDNGAVTLCGRAITHKWHRSRGSDAPACNQCQGAETAIRASAERAASRGRGEPLTVTPQRVRNW